MIVALCFSLVQGQDCVTALPEPVPERSAALADDPALDAKISAAGKDVVRLLDLASSCTSAGQDADAKKVYRKVLEIDSGNEAAHKALNHQFYDKKWFESFAELAKYRREETARMKAKGLARVKDGEGEWVPEGDVPFLKMGWAKDEKGAWANPVDLARAKQIADWTAAGYQFRADDNSWIAPEDFEHWKAKLWKCGDEWVDMDKANEYHAKPESCWELEGEHFVVWATCDWDGAFAARWYADHSYPELVRIFGLEAPKKPHFIVLNSLTQYNQVAGATTPLLPESEGFSSFHGAYFADQVFDATQKPPQYEGAGVCYWDRKDEKMKAWGPYFLRWAAAQSYVDAIDPSWGFIGEWVASAAAGGTRPEFVTFWNEKKIPRWLRFGAASYVERYMRDPEAAQGASPWTLRTFAFGELKKAGPLHKIDEILAFALDSNKVENSTRLYQEAGLLVAYMMDGAPTDKKLAADHAALVSALKSGTKKAATDAITAIQKDLAAKEHEIKVFAGL